MNCIDKLKTEYYKLHEKNPNNQIDIETDFVNKTYSLKLTDKPFEKHPQVPIMTDLKVVYGDSCTGDTPLLLMKDDTVYIKTIQSIFDENNKIEYPEFKMFDKTIRLEKEYSFTDYKIWTDDGWTNIKKVIKHRCNKKIYKVLTHTGCVKVTEDHSLLTENKQQIKPKDCNFNTKLLNSYPSEFKDTCNSISKDRAFIYGFFYGDGSAGFYKCNSGDKYSFALNNSDINILTNLKNLLQKEYPDSKPVIYDTLKSSGVYKLYIGNFENMVLEYRDKFYDFDKYKKVPTEILNSNNEIIQSFFDGYFLTDGCDNKGQIGSAGLYYLMKKLGYNVSLNTRNDKEKMLRITVTKKSQRKHSNKIKKIESFEHNDYVYDIETDIGRFQAGVGDLIIKNTDSIFIQFKYNIDDYNLNRLNTFKYADICSQQITKHINRGPIMLEFEKIFQPFILLSKKRYIAKKFEDVKNPLKEKSLDAKGVALVRRDYCDYVKKCFKQIVDEIMYNNISVVDTLDIYKDNILKIYNNNVDIKDLVLSSLLKSTYKTKPVHVLVAEKLKQRNEEVNIGDRIEYVYIQDTDPKRKKSECGENPNYVILNNIPINKLCYIEQLAKVLLGFYKSIISSICFNQLLEYTNNYITNLGGKKLKLSDFRIEEE